MDNSDEMIIRLHLDVSFMTNEKKISIDRDLLLKLVKAYNLLYEQNIDMSRELYL